MASTMNEETFISGRKWSVPVSAFTPKTDEHYFASSIPGRELNVAYFIVTPLCVTVVIEPDEHFGITSWVIGGAGGLSGASRHGDTFHIGTPGFALAHRLIAAMEELEASGTATPLPTKAVNSAGFTREEHEVNIAYYAEHDY